MVPILRELCDREIIIGINPYLCYLLTLLGLHYWRKSENGPVLSIHPMHLADANRVGPTHKAFGKQSPAGLDLWITEASSPLPRRNMEVLGIKVTERVDQKIEFAD